jgi:L-cysteine:1D-myo-inositol 2-amino-2-deoxy-alpha-D-glucopyranoside ligase
MARRLLQQPVDVHGGGSDLLFPHHESELAQALAAHPGERFVRHWMHAGMVGYADAKMSKSLGNLVFVRDLLARHDAGAIRRALLDHRYWEDWEFRDVQLADARDPPDGPDDAEAFFAALDDDLDTPKALAVLDRATASGQAWVPEGRAVLGLADLGPG